MARDYYEVLGVSRDATADQIQQAFRTLARKHHPDVNKDPAAEERFKEVNEAYHVLSDPETRKRYDRFGEDFRKVPEDWEERVGAGAGGASAAQGPPARGCATARASAAPAASTSKTFSATCSAAVADSGRFRAPTRKRVLELTVEEAYRGGKRQISLDGRNYGVNIPAGVIDGQRIRLAGEGGRGSGDGPAGDLYLRVRIKPHPRFRLDGRDVTVDLPVSPWEAVLGTTVAIRTPGGEAKVKVPQGSSTGRRLRLRGEGMPNPRGAAGDLYAEIKVMVPPKPTARERELFEQLAAESTFDPRRGR